MPTERLQRAETPVTAPLSERKPVPLAIDTVTSVLGQRVFKPEQFFPLIRRGMNALAQHKSDESGDDPTVAPHDVVEHALSFLPRNETLDPDSAKKLLSHVLEDTAVQNPEAHAIMTRYLGLDTGLPASDQTQIARDTGLPDKIVVGVLAAARQSAIDHADPQQEAIPPLTMDQRKLFDKYHDLIGFVAKRFKGRGESTDDNWQVAALEMLKTIRIFDQTKDVNFMTYAIRNMTGALKRHLRDSTWRVHVPRDVKEDAIRATSARAALREQLGRKPTTEELAKSLGLTREETEAALIAGNGYNTAPYPVLDTEGSPEVLVHDPEAHEGFDKVLNSQAVLKLLAMLPYRERRIVELRFYKGMSQPEIAKEVGMHQVSVSRLLKGALERLRRISDSPIL